MVQKKDWAEMGLAGRRKVEAEFEIESLNDELLELYKGLVGKGDQAHGEVRNLARVREGR